MNRFRRDVLWNLASVALLASSGLALNVVIGRYYGPEVFGVFSQVLAAYYLLSQLAVGGFGFSTLKFVADHAEDRPEAGRVVGTAALLTGALAAGICLLTYLGRGWIGDFFDSDGVAAGILWIIPGLWFFAVNKVLLFAVNGLRHMRFYAVASAARYLLILAALLALTARQVEGPVLAASLSAGEVILFPVLVSYLASKKYLRLGKGSLPWISRHLAFGMRAFFSGLLLDINLKVDVVILGYFASDHVVGIYSFAAMFAEGMYQIIYVIQTNVTPVLSQLKLDGRMSEVRQLVRRNVMLLPPSLAIASLVLAAAFPWLAEQLTGYAEFGSGWIYFAVLMAGLVVASSYLPFGFVLSQWGYPGGFMAYLTLLVGGNIVLNLLAIPILGALGAAIATAIAFSMAIVYLKVLTKWLTGVSI